MTRRGLSACSTSHPSPQRSRVPGRKFSVRTSASATSCLRISCPSGVFRSRVTHFLLRLVIFHHKGTSFLAAPSARRLSPRRGCSTLITSAPKSPMFCEIVGAAKSTAMSTILSPSNGRLPITGPPPLSIITYFSYREEAGRARLLPLKHRHQRRLQQHPAMPGQLRFQRAGGSAAQHHAACPQYSYDFFQCSPKGLWGHGNLRVEHVGNVHDTDRPIGKGAKITDGAMMQAYPGRQQGILGS